MRAAAFGRQCWSPADNRQTLSLPGQVIDTLSCARGSGYQINFNRVFFQYQPPRPLHEIDAELAGVEKRIMLLLQEVTHE